MLPKLSQDLTPERLNFPTRWQAVVFRNYRMISAERIAMVLECTVEDVEREAVRMGLRKGEYNPEWMTRGVVTVIRNNWYLLPYDQLETLLDYTEDRLSFILEKEDFLYYKLGDKKPICEKVVYAPLTADELAETERIAKLISKLDTSNRVYFDIYRDKTDHEPKYVTSSAGGSRGLHPYLTPCADPFIEDTRSHLPDSLLDDYAKYGINSLTVHGVLATLSPCPYDPDQSRDYKIRRKNLKDLVERAGKRGIKISLYFNEPRVIPGDKFEKYGRPELAGRITKNGGVSLCMEVEENRQWFYNAIKDLLEEIPDIGSIGSTNMGENPTHCLSSKRSASDQNCPRCANLPLHAGSITVCHLILKAVKDSGSKATVGCSTWQWTDEMIEEGFKELDPEISVSAISEWGVKTNIGGVPWEVIDYSIANYGPSERAQWIVKHGLETGHRAGLKVQMSCSWELAVCPYLPLFDLEFAHVKAVHDIGVRDLSLTWTLGSYPSITFDMVADFLNAPETFTLDKWYEKHFGKDGERVHEAVKLFSRGYREYPFSAYTAYHDPNNLGVSNRWSLTPNTNKTTMVNWTFDDPEYYAKPYPIDIYLNQYEKLLADWDKGIEILEGVDGDLAREILLFAKVAGNHFRSSIVHTKYVLAKRKLPESKDEMRAVIAEERALCEELIELLPQSTMIAYETSNHYFYTERDIIEKLVQLDGLEKELDNM